MKEPMPMIFAAFITVAGLLLGTVFTFGMQFWSAEVTRAECEKVESSFYSHTRNKEIQIYCTDGEMYSVDGVLVDAELLNALADMETGEPVSLILHPNGNSVLELRLGDEMLLYFEDSIEKLGREADGFLSLGIFMYLCAAVGIYHGVLNVRRRKRAEKGR